MVPFNGETLLSFLQLWTGWRPATDRIPSVLLDHATVMGVRNGSLEYFLGIPYAKPPVSDLRFRPPRMIESYDGTLDATHYGHPCPSLDIPNTYPPEVAEGVRPLHESLVLSENVTESEDCLSLNVVRPANMAPDARLPVIFWIHGGGFVQGSNAVLLYNGTRFVEKSIELDEPVIYVAVNYRLNILGFLGGIEVKDAGIGNLGLQDQRASLHWVNKFISSFGGDPSKVTIWGESAGAISVFLQLYANGGDTEGLFRAGIMSSGFAPPTKDIATVQDTYDFVVEQVGCSSAGDTLGCLRTVPVDRLLAAANAAPGGMLSFFAREDGSLISMPPMHLPSKGRIANVPLITGTVKDEGTYIAFATLSLNITTDSDLTAYLAAAFFPGASHDDFSTVLEMYPPDPAAGSPFDTGDANVYAPQFKRVSAITGDWFFDAPRRLLLDAVSDKQTVYNFLYARGNVTGMGSYHGVDLLNALAGGDMADYFVRFVSHLDPNKDADSETETGVHWLPYKSRFSASGRSLGGGSILGVPLNASGAMVGVSHGLDSDPWQAQRYNGLPPLTFETIPLGSRCSLTVVASL